MHFHYSFEEVGKLTVTQFRWLANEYYRMKTDEAEAMKKSQKKAKGSIRKPSRR